MSDHAAVANEILRQLGGAMFVRMTGAKSLMACRDECGALSFKLPSTAGFVKDGINYVKVTLTAGDDYTITFGRVWGTSVKTLRTHHGVYCDNLRCAFTEFTGLQTSLVRQCR